MKSLGVLIIFTMNILSISKVETAKIVKQKVFGHIM